MELLQRTLKDLGQTMVMITHNEAVAAEADRRSEMMRRQGLPT